MKTIEELDALHAAATEGEWFQDPTKAWVVRDRARAALGEP